MKGNNGGKDGRDGVGGISAAKNDVDVPSNSTTTRNTTNNNDTTSPTAEEDMPPLADSNILNNVAVNNDSPDANPSSVTSRDLARMSRFTPTPTTTTDDAAEPTSTSSALSNTSPSLSSAAVQSMPGAYAVPGINSTTTSGSAPMATTTDEGSFPTRDQLRRLSSRTRLQVLSSLLSGGAAGVGNGSNSALISSLVNSTDFVIAEATLVPDADAVRASQASPDIPIGEDVLNDGTDDGDEEEVRYNDEENMRSRSGSDAPPENIRRSYISALTSGDEETHATGAGSVPTMVTAVTAESMQGKHVLSRRSLFFLAAGVLVLLGIALGVAIPLTAKNRESSGSEPEDAVDLSEVLTYAPEAICYSHIPLMTDLSRVCTDPSTLPKGGPFCQLVTDGILAQLHRIHRKKQQTAGLQQAADGGGTSNELPLMPKVDMVITNAGAQRGDILPSNVTLGDIRKHLPFVSDRVVLLEVSPFDIHRSLEGGLNYTLQTIPIKVSFSSGYPYASNLRFDIDLTQPYGQRVSNIELWRENDFDDNDDKEAAVVDTETDGGGSQMGSGRWMLLDPTDTSNKFIAATNSYLAGGGDQYFPNIHDDAKTLFSDLGFTDTFADFCRGVDILLGPHYIDGMSTRNFVPLDEY